MHSPRSKFSAIERKRQREPDAVAAATSTPDAAVNTAVTSTPSTAPPSSAAFTFAPSTAGPKFVPETQALRDENRDLKHQLSVIAAQLASFQASMTAQIGGLSSQVVSLSQQVAKLSARSPENPLTKTYSWGHLETEWTDIWLGD